MDLSRILLKEMVKSSESGKKVSFKYNSEMALEYLKWLSYVPEFEKQYITNLTNKNIEELSSSEIERIKQFKKQQEILPVFERYISDDCKKEDILPVYDYMKEISLDKLIKTKLTEEEHVEGLKQIAELSKLPTNDLCDLVKEQRRKIYSLTMIQAFVLHRLSSISTARATIENAKEISIQVERNNFKSISHTIV